MRLLARSSWQRYQSQERPAATRAGIARPVNRPNQGGVMVSFAINGKSIAVEAEPATPLLWIIRDHIGLTGTKYGCGAGLCGACTVHINGKAERSCQVE